MSHRLRLPLFNPSGPIWPNPGASSCTIRAGDLQELHLLFRNTRAHIVALTTCLDPVIQFAQIRQRPTRTEGSARFLHSPSNRYTPRTPLAQTAP